MAITKNTDLSENDRLLLKNLTNSMIDHDPT